MPTLSHCADVCRPLWHPAQVMWTMGGTFLLVGTVVEVFVLYQLDQV